MNYFTRAASELITKTWACLKPRNFYIFPTNRIILKLKEESWPRDVSNICITIFFLLSDFNRTSSVTLRYQGINIENPRNSRKNDFVQICAKRDRDSISNRRRRGSQMKWVIEIICHARGIHGRANPAFCLPSDAPASLTAYFLLRLPRLRRGAFTFTRGEQRRASSG